MSDAPRSGSGAPRKKKAASAFKRPASSVFASVIAGAEDVVANSFIAQGTGSPSGPAPAKPGQDGVFVAAPPSPAPASAFLAPAPAPERPAPQTAPADGTNPPAAFVQQQPAAAPSPARIPQPAPAPTAGPALAPAPAPEPTPEPEPEEPTTAVTRPVAQRRRAARRPGGVWAHQAVTESFADAVISSNTWTTHGFRIVPEVLNALKVRLALDRRTSGNSKLAVGHYLDAALRHAPTEVGEQVASAQAFLTQRMGIVDSGRQSTYRVGPQALALATTLNTALQEADHARKGIFVVSAALESLLQSLDTEGDMPSPGAFSRGL